MKQIQAESEMIRLVFLPWLFSESGQASQSVRYSYGYPSSEGISILLAIVVFSARPTQGSVSWSFMPIGMNVLFTETAEDFNREEIDYVPYGVRSE